MQKLLSCISISHLWQSTQLETQSFLPLFDREQLDDLSVLKRVWSPPHNGQIHNRNYRLAELAFSLFLCCRTSRTSEWWDWQNAICLNSDTFFFFDRGYKKILDTQNNKKDASFFFSLSELGHLVPLYDHKNLPLHSPSFIYTSTFHDQHRPSLFYRSRTTGKISTSNSCP
jgi:hypothetical protein